MMKCLFKVLFVVIFVIIPSCKNEPLQSVNINGTDCRITEPLYNITFDLNGLKSDLGHKIHGETNDFIEFNVCGDVLKACNGKSHVSACYSRAAKEEIIGVGSELSLINGRLEFTFTGEKCNNNTNYRLQIVLLCDYSNVKDPFNFIPHSDNECTFYVTWKTKFACFPLPEKLQSNTCTVKDESNAELFNLMPLSQDNHRIPDRNGSHFIINICKPTPYSFDEMCPPESSICHMKDAEIDLRKKFTNYGLTIPNPIYSNRKLSMTFKSNEKCNDHQNISSIITFSCDSTTEGEPEYIGHKDCQHSFIWGTRYACNKFHTCTVIDSITGFTYDLSTLANKEYEVKANNSTYTFGICNAAASSCGANSGACKANGIQKIGLGKFNDNLRYNETGSPYLVYTGGAVCEGLSTPWSTKIEFLCAADGQTHGPKIIEDTKCQIIIQYTTDLVCQKPISCKAYNWIDNVDIDLTPLMNYEHNYIATVSDGLMATEGPPIMYYISVCKPLIPQYGLSCPGGTAACRAKNGNDTPINEQSLGFPDVSLTVVNTSHGARAQLRYLRGSACPTDHSAQLSTQIEFFCDVKAGRGVPILHEISDCEYKFEWPTNVICPRYAAQFLANSCEIYNEQTSVTMDLKAFTDDGRGKIAVNQNSGTFDVNVCGNNRKIEADYAQGTAKIFFDAKGACKPDDTINVELRLVCKADEKNVSWTDITSCAVVLIKETPMICSFIGIANKPKEGFTFKPLTVEAAVVDGVDGGGNSKIGAVLIITVAVIGLVIINVYIFKSPERRGKIKSLFSRRNVAVQYTRVRSDEEANLLLSQPDRISDSDDELLV